MFILLPYQNNLLYLKNYSTRYYVLLLKKLYSWIKITFKVNVAHVIEYHWQWLWKKKYSLIAITVMFTSFILDQMQNQMCKIEHTVPAYLYLFLVLFNPNVETSDWNNKYLKLKFDL